MQCYVIYLTYILQLMNFDNTFKNIYFRLDNEKSMHYL